MRPDIRPGSSRWRRSMRRRSLDGSHCKAQTGHYLLEILRFRRVGRQRIGQDMLQEAGPATAAADGLIKDTTTQTFLKDVIEESKQQPVLVDFWAEWCGPCKQRGPTLEKVIKAAKGKVKLVKMDIDKHPQIPGQLGIQSIPA